MSIHTRSSEAKLRARFDFGRAQRGRFAGRYKEGARVAVLEGAPDGDDPLASVAEDSQLVEIAGKQTKIQAIG